MEEPSSVKKYGVIRHVISRSKISKEKRSYSILSEIPKDFSRYEKVPSLDKYLTLIGGSGYKSHRSIVRRQVIKLIDDSKIIMIDDFVITADVTDDGYLIYSRKHHE